MRILVVDDNLDAAEMLARALEMMGYESATALDATEALRVAGVVPPDVALLDIGLPGVDGYELAARLRDAHPSMKLVAITGYSRDTDRARARQAGFDEHVVKPVDLDALRALLARLAR